MVRKVFVFIEGETVKCYPNLRELARNHIKVSYFSAYRALLKSNYYPKDSYIIAIDTIRYKTKRGFNNKQTYKHD